MKDLKDMRAFAARRGSRSSGSRRLAAVAACLFGGASLASHASAGLLAYYSFNDGTANDQSGNGRNATVYGATLTTDRFGNANQAYYFDGVNDYIQTPVNSNTTYVAFSVWFRADTVAGERSIIDSDADGKFGHSLIINYDGAGPTNTNHLDVEYHNGAFDTGTGGLVTVGRWHHAVVSFDTSSNIDVYLDGTLIYSQPYVLTGSFDGSDFRMGRHNPFDPQWFQGAIDDVKFFDNALTAADVQTLFNASAVPGTGLAGLATLGLARVARRRRR
jgi:hypothetical protein